jgi:hypothetical protein
MLTDKQGGHTFTRSGERRRLVNRALASLVLALFALVSVTGLARAQEENCSAYETQEEAQAVFDADPSDPNGLDADGNGIACEDLPSAEDVGRNRDRDRSGRDDDSPRGGVDSGFGGTALSLPVLLIAGGALLSVGVGASVGLRRARKAG